MGVKYGVKEQPVKSTLGKVPLSTSNAQGAVWETSGACVVTPITSLGSTHVCFHVHSHTLVGVNVRCDHSGEGVVVSPAHISYTPGVCLVTL